MEAIYSMKVRVAIRDMKKPDPRPAAAKIMNGFLPNTSAVKHSASCSHALVQALQHTRALARNQMIEYRLTEARTSLPESDATIPTQVNVKNESRPEIRPKCFALSAVTPGEPVP
jgi:hypothetical protein